MAKYGLPPIKLDLIKSTPTGFRAKTVARYSKLQIRSLSQMFNLGNLGITFRALNKTNSPKQKATDISAIDAGNLPPPIVPLKPEKTGISSHAFCLRPKAPIASTATPAYIPKRLKLFSATVWPTTIAKSKAAAITIPRKILFLFIRTVFPDLREHCATWHRLKQFKLQEDL